MIVGLTGGIGCGKSTVARLLRIMGHPVYDSDQRARLLQENDENLIRDMVELLGSGILEEGRLNRKRVAGKVFGHPELLERLNRLVHPRVKKDFEQWSDQQKTILVFKESALLVETGAYRDCDALVLVRSPEWLRIKRVMQRDAVSKAEVKVRIESQASEASKVAVADFIIHNDEKQMLILQAEQLVQTLKSRH